MIRHLLVFISLYFIAFSACAQTVEWSTPEKTENRYIKIIGQDAEGFFVLKSNISLGDYRFSTGFRKREYYIAYYSDDMNRRWEKPVVPLTKDDRILAIVFLDEKPVVINVHMIPDSKRFILSAQKMNNTGNFEEQAYPINEFSYDKKNEMEEFDFITSQDQSKLLCYQTGSTTNENYALYSFLLNTELKVEQKKIIQLPESEKTMAINSLTLSNDGNLYILGKHKKEDKDKKIENSGFTVLCYNFRKDSLAVSELALENKFLTAATLSVDNINKKIVVAGFYSDKTSYSITGTYFMSLGYNDLSVNVSKSDPFDPSFLTRLIGESQASKGKELTNYYVDRIILRNDGGAVMLAESYYTTSSSYYDVFLQSYMTKVNYHYNSVISVSVNPDGSIHWPQAINKSQTSQEDGGFYSSYCILPHKDKIFFIYNEYSGRSNRVMLNSVSNTGQSASTVLFKGNEDIILIPKAARQIDQNVLIIPGERDDKFCYLKLTF